VARGKTGIKNSKTNSHEFLNFTFDSIFIQTLQGCYIEVNDNACQILGYTREELLSMTLDVIHAVSPVFTEDLHLESLQQAGTLVYESQLRTRLGKCFPVEVTRRMIDYNEAPSILSIVRDISERKQHARQMEALQKQKDVLLKEVYHRVKNNFMIISSLLHLQSNKINDESSRSLFRESRDRVQTMALIHQQLYQSSDLASIDFKGYLQLLIKNLYQSYGVSPEKVQLIQNLEAIPVGIDKAIPCGLIVNELLTNAFKYAFPENHSGFVRIDFQHGGPNNVRLCICDNGIGLPNQIKVHKSHSLGLQIVTMLTRQIQGRLSVKRKRGTCVTVIFPNNPDESR
jgi:PAS domain S-box-containing protein